MSGTSDFRGRPLIVAIDQNEFSDSIVRPEIMDHESGEWKAAPVFMVVDSFSGVTLKSGYHTFDEAVKEYPEAVNAGPSWVNTRGLDAETVLEFTMGLYTISGMFEGRDAFRDFVLEQVREFQKVHSGFASWEDYEPHPDDAILGISDYWTVIDQWCQNLIEEMRVQGSMP